jgi:hypothetical protein
MYGFVHKKVSPETILSISRAATGKLASTVRLVGFQLIRKADGQTYKIPDRRWEANLYRHPTRQGVDTAYYIMQHDIYSLGVCLLGIGLWDSFVAYDGDNVAQPTEVLCLDAERSLLKDLYALKDHFVHMSANTVLKAKMGTKHSDIVQTCLTCLDEDNLDFMDDKEF